MQFQYSVPKLVHPGDGNGFLVFVPLFLNVPSQGNTGQVFLGIRDLYIIHNPLAPPYKVHTPICANHEKHCVTKFQMVFMSSLSFMSCLNVFYSSPFFPQIL
jgi:hypothetical protein